MESKSIRLDAGGLLKAFAILPVVSEDVIDARMAKWHSLSVDTQFGPEFSRFLAFLRMAWLSQTAHRRSNLLISQEFINLLEIATQRPETESASNGNILICPASDFRALLDEAAALIPYSTSVDSIFLQSVKSHLIATGHKETVDAWPGHATQEERQPIADHLLSIQIGQAAKKLIHCSHARNDPSKIMLDLTLDPDLSDDAKACLNHADAEKWLLAGIITQVGLVIISYGADGSLEELPCPRQEPPGSLLASLGQWQVYDEAAWKTQRPIVRRPRRTAAMV